MKNIAMKKRIKIVLIALMLCGSFAIFAQPASARSLDEVKLLEQLTTLNRYPPLRSSEFDLSSQVLGRRIIDRKNKVVGQIKDVIINSNGGVEMFLVEFDRLKVSGAVYMDANELKVGDFTKRYSIDMNDEELVTMFPTLLANTATAAGDATEMQSVGKVVGAEVISDDGRRLGTVENVLFDNSGKKARGLYVNFTHSAMGSNSFAIPFSMVSFAEKTGKTVIVVDPAEADLLVEFIKRK
jgi:sporulation protein YlmC with PRC-barrel domain